MGTSRVCSAVQVNFLLRPAGTLGRIHTAQLSHSMLELESLPQRVVRARGPYLGRTCRRESEPRQAGRQWTVAFWAQVSGGTSIDGGGRARFTAGLVPRGGTLCPVTWDSHSQPLPLPLSHQLAWAGCASRQLFPQLLRPSTAWPTRRRSRIMQMLLVFF
jgi:hypothetical protein